MLLFQRITIFCSFCLGFPFPLAFGCLTAGKSLDILMAMSLVGRFLKWLRNWGRKEPESEREKERKEITSKMS